MHVFLPPLKRLEDALNLIALIEKVAAELGLPLRLGRVSAAVGSAPQSVECDTRSGVIEVNIHPAASWNELVANTTTLYETARQYLAGHGKIHARRPPYRHRRRNHITLGGHTLHDSPILRGRTTERASSPTGKIIPALSYLFSGMFIGPTSQAREWTRRAMTRLYELAESHSANGPGERRGQESQTAVAGRPILRNLLVDLTGNTHRAEFCIDKLYSPDGAPVASGCLSCAHSNAAPCAHEPDAELLLRALVARFWRGPMRRRSWRAGAQSCMTDSCCHTLSRRISLMSSSTSTPPVIACGPSGSHHLEFRFPQGRRLRDQRYRAGSASGMEPWHVLGEEGADGHGALCGFVPGAPAGQVTGLTPARYRHL